MLAIFIGLEEEAKGTNSKTSMDYPSRETKLLIKRYCETLGVSVANFTMSLYRNALIAGFDKANLTPEEYKEAMEDLEKYLSAKRHLTEHPFLKNVNLAYGRTGRIDYHDEGAYEKIKALGGIIPVGAWREAVPDDNPPNERAKYIDQLGNFFDKEFYWWDPSFNGWYNKIPFGAGNMFYKALCTEQIEIKDYDHPIFEAQIKDSRFKMIRRDSFDDYKNYTGITDDFRNEFRVDPDEAQRKLVAENLKAETLETIIEKLSDVKEDVEVKEKTDKELLEAENILLGYTKPIPSLSQLGF